MELDKEKLAPARATAKYDKKELASEEFLKYALVFAHKGIAATIEYSDLKNQHKIPQQNSQTETNLQNTISKQDKYSSEVSDLQAPLKSGTSKRGLVNMLCHQIIRGLIHQISVIVHPSYTM